MGKLDEIWILSCSCIPPFSAVSNTPLMKTIKHLLALSLVAFLSACATYKAVPDGFTGPMAIIKDTAEPDSGSKGIVFYVSSIDDNPVQNARIATRQSSQGTGFSLNTRGFSRPVPVRAMKLRLVGTHVTGAPIHELASRAAGTFFSVEGDITFTPKEGVMYRVQGDLKKTGSSVWIEVEDTKEVVAGTKIEGK
jgi:hypothetical protein